MNNKKTDIKCWICLQSASLLEGEGIVSCPRCAKYSITNQALAAKNLLPDEKRHILSGIVRNRFEQTGEPTRITTENVQALLDSMPVPSKPFGAIDSLLHYLRDEGGTAAKPVQLENAYPIVFAEDHNEFDNYLRIACDKRYIEHREGGRCYKLITKGWDRLAELDKLAEQEPDVEISPEMLGETERVLDGIKKGIQASSLEDTFKGTALYDLEQAKLAYQSGAFKACIVMLGAVLEGLMLGTILRPEVLQRIKTDPPKVVKKLGLNDPQLTDKIAEELGFEDYKNIIHHLIPEIEKLRVEDIQTFRNAIHPWKIIKEPTIYAAPDQTRAINHLTSLEILARRILSWTP